LKVPLVLIKRSLNHLGFCKKISDKEPFKQGKLHPNFQHKMEEELKFMKHKEELLSSLGLLADFPADLRYALCCYPTNTLQEPSFFLVSLLYAAISLMR
jgi:hypothetical protein